MKIQDIIVEGKKSPKAPTRRVQQPSRGIHVYGDAERMNTDYTHYRLMMALACANGIDPIDIDAKSWFGKQKTAHPYTDAEAAMLKQSYDAVGADYQDINDGDLDSKELNSTNKSSVVAKIKPNRFGV